MEEHEREIALGDEISYQSRRLLLLHLFKLFQLL